MQVFYEWWAEQEAFAGDGAMFAAESAWDAAQEITALRCKEIVRQRSLAENQVAEIEKRISLEFCV